MNLRNKKQNNRKNKTARANEEAYEVLDPIEVKQYEKGRLKKGARFGKKWFPENKKN